MELLALFTIWSFISLHTSNQVTLDRDCNKAKFQAVDRVVCRDDENRQVDWFILYKEPSPNGDNYLIMTSSDSSPHWKSVPHGFALLDGAPALESTLSPLSSGRVTYAMYSDQPPTRNTAVGKPVGHSKGVLAKFGNRGFFLVHSLPKFPLPRCKSSNQEWSENNGQIFMCVSLDANNAQWTNVLTHFSNLVPFKYERSEDWKEPAPRFVSHIDLLSLGGTKFRLFSTYGRDGVDIYGDVIAKYYNASLDVATWRNGAGGKLPSQCEGKQSIRDVTRVNYTAITEHGSRKTGSWKSSKDHSKWAVSRGKGGVFCVGDLNRMESQRTRNGGAVCFENKKVITIFSKMFMSTECGKRYGGRGIFADSSAEE